MAVSDLSIALIFCGIILFTSTILSYYNNVVGILLSITITFMSLFGTFVLSVFVYENSNTLTLLLIFGLFLFPALAWAGFFLGNFVLKK
jgi:hypothetical protein